MTSKQHDANFPEQVLNYSPQSMAYDGDLNLLDLLLIIWKGKWFIMFFTLICTLAMVYVTLYVLPVLYKSEVVIQPTDVNTSSGFEALAGMMPIGFTSFGAKNNNAGILTILESRTIKEKLIEKYNLLPKLFPKIWDQENQKWIVESKKEIPTKFMGSKIIKNVLIVDKDDTKGLIVIKWIDGDPEFTKIMLERVVEELNFYFENEYDSGAKRKRGFIEKQQIKSEDELEYWEKKYPQRVALLQK